MKYCENCGTQLDDNARFCKKCGVFFDVAEHGADGAEAPKDTKETAQPVPANESQEKPDAAETSASEQTSEPGGGDKPPADKKSGYIGCIVLIFLVVVLFKGCGMLFGDSSKSNTQPQNQRTQTQNQGNTVRDAFIWTGKNPPQTPDASMGRKYSVAFYAEWKCEFCRRQVNILSYDRFPFPVEVEANLQSEICPGAKDRHHLFVYHRRKQWMTHIAGYPENAWVLTDDGYYNN